MIAKIEKSSAAGTVAAPPSKSMAHRYLIGGALSAGSVISGVVLSNDIRATLSCLQALGADVTVKNDTVHIGGLFVDQVRSSDLFCGESGSTLRFLLPLCLLTEQEITLHGTKRLMSRSLSVYEELCRTSGIRFSPGETGVTVKGRLQAGKYTVRGDISSQFISGLLVALPLLSGDSVIEVTGGIESGSYLNMTVKALADFGVRVSRADENAFFIKGGQIYKKRELTVEGDYSNAAFFEALHTVGGDVSVTGLAADTLQGDAVYRKHFAALAKGAALINVSDCPDLAPILMAVAAANHGAVLTGTRRLKIKESDRGKAMAEELAKFGIRVRREENRITVEKGKLHRPVLPLYGHNDHRIVMALTVLCTLTGGEIYGAKAVAKSFPDFFERIKTLGIEVKLVENHEAGTQ